MSGMLDYVAEAIRLLRDQADAVHESHNAPGETTFEGEPEAEAAYAELERVANGLETEIAARLRGDAAQPAAPAPVAGDAVRNAASALLEKLLSIHGSSEYQAVWQIAQLHRGPYTGPKYDEEMAALKAALAQDRASQGAAPSAPVGDDRWKALIVQWQRRAEAVGYDGVEDALDAAIAAKSAPAPVAGEAVAKLPAKWREGHKLTGQFSAGINTGYKRAADELESALAQDRAAPVVTDAMVETVGSALYKYWNDVNEDCRGKYRERVRAALEAALKGT